MFCVMVATEDSSQCDSMAMNLLSERDRMCMKREHSVGAKENRKAIRADRGKAGYRLDR